MLAGLLDLGIEIAGSTVVVTGDGPAAPYVVQALARLGARVVVGHAWDPPAARAAITVDRAEEATGLIEQALRQAGITTMQIDEIEPGMEDLFVCKACVDGQGYGS